MDSKDLVSYLGMCVSFILIFNIFIKYYKHFNRNMSYYFEKLGKKTINSSTYYIEKCYDEISDDERRGLANSHLMSAAENIENHAQKHLECLNHYTRKTRTEQHFWLSFNSIIIAVLTTQTVYMPTVYVFETEGKFDDIWSITIIFSLILYCCTIIGHTRKMEIASEELGKITRRYVVLFLTSLVIFGLTFVPLYCLKQLFFINIFIFYYLALFVSKWVLPRIDNTLIVNRYFKMYYEEAQQAIKSYYRNK